MKSYWQIPGPSRSTHLRCRAFAKYDGNQLRFEWTKKNGWSKFGTRYRLFNQADEEYGDAIPLFMETYADDLASIFRNSKRQHFRGVTTAVVFCEYYGPGSFAGAHRPGDEMELMMFDVAAVKKGIILPADFVKLFGHLKTPAVVYEGHFNKQFIEAVKAGEYPVDEGVVAKGVNLGKKQSPQHGLWMTKVKTKVWMDRLKKVAVDDPTLARLLSDNLREQTFT